MQLPAPLHMSSCKPSRVELASFPGHSSGGGGGGGGGGEWPGDEARVELESCRLLC